VEIRSRSASAWLELGDFALRSPRTANKLSRSRGKMVIGPSEEGWRVAQEPVPDLSRVYEAYHAKVVAYAARLLGRDEADDVAQEVFVKVGRSLDTLADSSKLTSWIYAITLNTVRDTARKRCSGPDRFPASLGSPREGGEEEPAISRIPDTRSRTPEETLERHEMVACYLDYVKQLPPSYYEVYVLSEFEHLSNEEIARRLALPLGTVKIRLHRARAKLQEQLRLNCQCYHNDRGELMGEPKRRPT
jgi:RNA polymerase sigma-70 factor (ECF subfamily)